MSQHFTPAQLQKLKEVYAGNNPTFLTYEEIWKNHFPAIAAEIERLWKQEAEVHDAMVDLEDSVLGVATAFNKALTPRKD